MHRHCHGFACACIPDVMCLFELVCVCAGGEIASTFEHPELVALGECDLIEEIMIGEDRMLRFSGVKAGEACT